MTNNNRLEGNGAARVLQLMKEQGHNVDTRYHIATVVSVIPFSIQIPGDPFVIDHESLFVPQSFLPHERVVKINGQSTHDSISGIFNGDTLTLTFSNDYISPGDSVMVAEANDAQKYYVLDKVVD
ncbi:DUF2577 family protein [Paenisporosarcina sp. NPDC076898]|uniref:DUF2577 family protein n=1 Tax=unclassified Paenisporosarcina TaxID=2642018 RepID=UPI003D0174A1